MLTVILPGPQEATFFAKRYELKKDLNCRAFPVYTNQNIIACAAGRDAAIAISFLAGRYGANRQSNHWLLIIVKADEKAGIVYPHTLTDDEGNSFYPEHLFRHPFVEQVLHHHYEAEPIDAAAAYQTAARFWPLHQIIVLQATLTYFSDIITWLVSVMETGADLFSDQERQAIDAIIRQMRLTHALRQKFHTACAAYKNQNRNLLSILNNYKDVCCANKQERASVFEKLQQSLRV